MMTYHTKRTFVFVLLTLLLTGSANAQTHEAEGLKDVYRNYFTIGVAVNQRNVTDPTQMALIKKEFNSITAENDMKSGSLHPKEDVWRWQGADRIANFCRQNGIKLRGHCLVWHAQFCYWMMTDKKGRPASKRLFFKRLRKHIHTVVKRYKDVVYAWDVVNEAMDDGGPSAYRQSQLYKLYGDEFIAKAFKYAHEADPSALLFYNDYNAAIPTKRDRIYNMVKKMQAAGVPITGIGMQGHCNIYGPSAQDVDAALTKYAELVSHIHITELDVRCNKEMGGQLQFSKGDTQQMTDSLAALQAAQYDRLFQVFRNHKDVIDNVTFWNLCDGDSWLGVNNHPLLFDEHLQPKRAYYKVKHFNPNN